MIHTYKHSTQILPQKMKQFIEFEFVMRTVEMYTLYKNATLFPKLTIKSVSTFFITTLTEF